MPKSIKIGLILLLALFLRLFSLHTLPPSLFSDEVDIALQVRSLRQNGTDYYGNRNPIHFHSFSDWRTSLQIYSSVVVSYFTTYPVLIVRLPSVIFSILTVLLFYLITSSSLSALLLALSPWSLHFGRTGFEVSGMLFSLLTGIYFWQNYFKHSKIVFLFLSFFFLSLSPYFYSTAKLFLIFVFPLLFFVWPIKLIAFSKKYIYLLFFFIILLFTPLFIDTLRGNAGFRFSYISIFTEPHREQITDTLRYQDILQSHPDEIGVPTPFLSYILHNKYQLVWEKFVSNYLSSFSTSFLFLKGDSNLRQGFGSQGLLFVLDFFLIFIGVSLYLRKPTKLGTFFLIFLFLAPVPFALTRDSSGPHATRLMLMLLPLLYFSSLGLKKYLFVITLYILSFLLFWHHYTIHYPQISARYWHYNLKEAVIASSQTNSNTIYFSDSSEPFIPFFLLYYPYNQDSITSKITPVHNDFIDGSQIDLEYYFGRLNWSNLSSLPSDTLIVAPESEKNLFPSDFLILKKIDKNYIEAETYYLLQKQ